MVVSLLTLGWLCVLSQSGPVLRRVEDNPGTHVGRTTEGADCLSSVAHSAWFTTRALGDRTVEYSLREVVGRLCRS